MSQPVKTPEQIDAMRECGKILGTILRDLKAYVKPGMTGVEVNSWVASEITRHGATATYREPVPDFPGVICISVNDAIVHGVPNDMPFEEGDIVGFDLVITYKGMKTDSAFSMVVGGSAKGAAKHLLSATERSLYAGIDAIKGRGTRTGDIGAAVEKVLSDAKLGIIRDLVGHGVGLEMHMGPDVPNYGTKGSGVMIEPGDTIAIEPMATLGGEKNYTDQDDGWTILTRDGSLAAHFEHTVLITENGAEILTLPE
ncbi:type I methionyl aminopeptidase [Candidatus Saccharibacteria bacterium]|jgi:methionyl aminopeptidase|nr:type I methionyl aminopeptidase [Candidatus Saccharibacteria bacterium]